jgi:hypothetical protein
MSEDLEVEWSYHRRKNEDEIPIEQRKAACNQWWDQLTDDERKKVFVELVADNVPAASHFIYFWIRDFVNKDQKQRAAAEDKSKKLKGWRRGQNKD